jgi:hypothetical protein
LIDGSAVVTTRLSSEAMNSAADVTTNAQTVRLLCVISLPVISLSPSRVVIDH